MSLRKFLEKPVDGNSRGVHTGSTLELLPTLCKRLGTSAQNLLRHNWDNDNLDTSWKSKGELIQKLLHIYLENGNSTSDLLDELSCSFLTQVSSGRTSVKDNTHSFPTLHPATLVVWYRVMHAENLAILNKLVKEIVLLEKHRAGVQPEDVERLLKKLQQSVNVVVSLVSLCRMHDKVAVHAMAVKYGGKFVDSFLKVFDFLRTKFQMHNELIIQLVKELQKATRTIQILCSEAKGLKQTVITSKIPSTKRSMERFLFHVKALLHNTSNGCTFWMGNLKHKDLMGQVVSSQAYVGDPNENIDESPADVAMEDQPINVAGDEDKDAK